MRARGTSCGQMFLPNIPTQAAGHPPPPRTRGRRVGQEAGRNLCCRGDPVFPSSAPAVRPHRSKPVCDAAPTAAATLTTPSLTFPTHPQEDEQ